MDDTITNMSLVDWLEDLSVRFLINLPASELSSVPRLCFQVEEAQWFYEDFIRPAAAAAGHPLPSLALRQFCLQLFQHCPLLSGFTDAQHIAAYEEFLAYKVRVPVRGAILMDESMEKLVLVKGWKKGASWSFPRGKINKDEKDLDCAIREVYEETGYDIRQAGLVPANEQRDAKYIDVTMREQHMRLFVFKGVPEDTYFEPQTRKEISKIAWYNVRDLPGFKKHKQGVDQTGHASKFYMVAPFLGQLKRWINQQKKSEVIQEASIATPGIDLGYAPVGAEEETEVEEPVPQDTETDKSEELKRLLSIGAPAVPAAQETPAPTNGQGNNLLALLRGGPKPSANLPQTPIEQINAFPQEPQTPNPHHPRHPSMGYQQPVPQFPFSPQRLQHQQQPQQRNFSVPAPGPFGPGPNGFQPNQQQAYPQVPPPHMHPQQFQQQRQSMPAGAIPRPGAFVGQQNGAPFSMPQRQPMQPPQMPPHIGLQQQQQPQQHFPRPSDAVMAQGPGAIEAGPAVPKAENLPMPNLNPHSMNLLNAFKSGSKPAAPSNGGASNAQPRQASQHQAALLDLFRKPSNAHTVPTPAAAVKAAEAAKASSPTPSGFTERPTAPQERRRSTLNEITRTLPPKLKARSPAPSVPVQQPPRQQMSMQAAVASTHSMAERPKTGQLYDPAHPQHFVRASSEAQAKPAAQAAPPDPQVKILQRPPSQQMSVPRGPKPGRSPKPKHASPATGPPMVAAAKGAENGTPTRPAFTILARPGSSARAYPKSPAPPQQQQQQHVPASPLRTETSKPAYQPHVLKRPESVDPATVQKAAEVVEERSGGEGGDKREQLLALFGKNEAIASPRAIETPKQAPAGADARKNGLLNLFTGPSQSAASTPTPVPAPFTAPQCQPQPREPDARKRGLLNLFGGSSQPATTSAAPPSAPHIQPERKPSSQNVTHIRQQTPQNALLDLFTKPSSSSALNSPGTPISPFTLGTPVTKVGPQIPASVMAPEYAMSRSRLSSVATADTSSSSRRGSGAVTPVEASKGFLLDYLNGVVQKEGHRGAKRS